MSVFRLLVLICISTFLAADNIGARPRNMAELAQIMRLVQPISLPGPIVSLYRPRYESVGQAELKLTATEPVFVALLPKGVYIYPQQYMLWHQVVNEIIDDRSYAITYCPLTGTLMVYDAWMDDMNLIFDVEGHETEGKFYGFLYDGNSVLMDRNTGSLWLQETGIAFDGPLIGRGMPTMPVFWTTWEAAKKVYPNAKVLARPRGRRPYGRDPYGSYLREDTYYDNDTLAYPIRNLDRRFPKKTRILGIEVDRLLMAIDINYIKREGAVNFFIGPTPLLAVRDDALDVIRIYNRQIWADPFLFVMRDGKLTDLATGSVWDPATGKAVSGNMKGSSMKEYFGVYSMWFAWASINPETLAIPGPGEVAKDLLKATPPGIDEHGNYVDPPEEYRPKDALPGRPQW